MNELLRGEPLDAHRVAHLVLLPKVSRVAAPKHYRPIARMEVLHKLYMKLLIARVQTTWPEPRYQLGGYPGSQVVDALFLATTELERESLERSNHIWISADVQSAFDTVDWGKLHDSLCRLTSSAALPELQRMLHEIHCHKLELHWEGRASRFQLHRGVLQGGCHSSQVFSATMECLFAVLHAHWCEQFPDEVDAWIYIDDCLLVFRSWTTVSRVLPWIQEQFAAFGFEWNVAKTKVCANDDTLQEGRRIIHRLPQFLQTCSWGDSFKYLGLRLSVPAMYSVDGPALSDILLTQAKDRALSGVALLTRILKRCHFTRWHTAIRLLDTFVGSRWLWMSPCMHPSQSRLQQVQSLQLGILAQVLKLSVPSFLNPGQQRSLHRIRRRACLELLRVRAGRSSWAAAWVTRKWGFLGHVLRRPDSHLPRRSLLAELHQARPGRAVTSARWLLTTLREVTGCADMAREHLSNLYYDREAWNSMIPSVLLHHGIPLSSQNAVVKEGTWDKWADPFRCHVSWLATCCVWEEAGVCHYKWLDTENGWMQLSFTGSWEYSVQQFFVWGRLVWSVQPLVVQFLLPSDLTTNHPLSEIAQQLPHDMPVILLECIPQSWFHRVLRL